MEKLTIKQASERFGLSRARLYKLLENGQVAGYRSPTRGKGGKSSWIDGRSLCEHVENKKDGRPLAMPNGDYIPIRMAAQKINLSIRYIHTLVNRGSVEAKKENGSSLVHYPNLLRYIKK